MPNICINCVKDHHLKELTRNEGILGQCSMCDDRDMVIDTENKRFFQLTKALVRYYFSEWDYNRHLGGDDYHSLFYGNTNYFFEESRAKSTEDYEDIVLSITDGPVYEEFDKGVTLFSGGMSSLPLRAMSTDLDSNILRISERLKTENHFNLESELTKILEKYSSVASLILKRDMVLFRARVGVKEKKSCYSRGYEDEIHYSPYKDQEITAPPPHLANSGRVNRAGVSFLYCASEKYTAVSEVRPHPSDKVSVAKFMLNRDTIVFDLSSSMLLNFFENDALLKNFIPINTLGALMNETIAPSDRIRYSITQLIADCIRQMGFDGIVFNSTVGVGKNIVFFDQNVASQDESGAEVFNVESVEYKCHNVSLVNDRDLYF